MGRDRNRELIEEYPWLDVGHEPLTLLNMLPIGWSGLILDMCKEIKEELVKYNLVSKYEVIEAKEKWYMLSWYDGLCDLSPMPSAITDIVCKYEMQSREVCMMCGRSKPKDKEICDRCMHVIDVWNNIGCR